MNRFKYFLYIHIWLGFILFARRWFNPRWLLREFLGVNELSRELWLLKSPPEVITSSEETFALYEDLLTPKKGKN